MSATATMRLPRAVGVSARELRKREQEAAEARARADAEDRARYRRSVEAINFASANPTPEVEAFMARSRAKRRVASLRGQLSRARARGSAKTLVPVDLLEELLDRVGSP